MLEQTKLGLEIDIKCGQLTLENVIVPDVVVTYSRMKIELNRIQNENDTNIDTKPIRKTRRDKKTASIFRYV